MNNSRRHLLLPTCSPSRSVYTSTCESVSDNLSSMRIVPVTRGEGALWPNCASAARGRREGDGMAQTARAVAVPATRHVGERATAAGLPLFFQIGCHCFFLFFLCIFNQSSLRRFLWLNSLSALLNCV